MDGQVEAHLLDFGLDPDAEQEIDDLDDDERADDRVADRRGDRDPLRDDLLRVAVEQPGVGGLDRGRGEDAGRDGPEHPADAVDREDVERVVDLGTGPQERGAVAQAARRETDEERAARRDEPRRRGDRDETGDRSAGCTDDADLPIVR